MIENRSYILLQKNEATWTGEDKMSNDNNFEKIEAAFPMTYTVTLRFQFPAWDEKDGIPFEDIRANSKKDAIKIAKRQADRDGHLCGGRGRYSFKAMEAK